MSAVSIDLPEDVSDRLTLLAERTGRSRTDYMLEAITEHIDDLEHLYVAEQRLTAHQAGESRSYSLDEVEQRLGLAD